MKTSLTKLERQYLDLLLNLPDGVPTDTFLDLHEQYQSGANLVSQHIIKLRKKVAGKYRIEAVYGVGYQLFPIEKEV